MVVHVKEYGQAQPGVDPQESGAYYTHCRDLTEAPQLQV